MRLHSGSVEAMLPREGSSFAATWRRRRLTLRFVDASVERRYRDALFDSLLFSARIGAGISAAACITMTAALTILRRHDLTPLLAMVAPVLTLLVSFSPRLRRTWLMPLEASCCAMGCGTMVVSNSIYSRPYNAMSPAVVSVLLGWLAALHGLFRLPLLHHSVAQAFMLVAYAAFSFATGWWPPLSDVVPTWIVILFVAGTFTWATWMYENENRSNWAATNANVSLKGVISDLKEELGLARKCSEQTMDMDSPLEKVLAVVRELRDQVVEPQLRQKVSFVMTTLTKQSDLFAADIASQIKGGRVAIDRETATWLLSEVAAKRVAVNSSRAVCGTQLLEPVGTLEPSFNSDHLSTMLRLPERLKSWDFDVFEVVTIVGAAHILPTIARAVLLSTDLVSQLGIDQSALLNFVLKIAKLYKDNPFHNQMHAADVLQTLYALLNLFDSDGFTPMEKFCLLVSAVFHDVDHPGTNNNFQIATSSPLAMQFNDRSVLENHHLLTAFSAMIEDDTGNFLSRLSTKEKREARSLMIELVLATDMGSHLSIVSAFNTKLKTASFDMNSADDRVLLMKVLLKAADISNIAKPPEVYGKWSAMILEEFFAQGDRERELGLPVSSFMDRSAAQAAVTKSQAGFIDYIGRPLFSAVCTFIGGPATAIMDIINTNRVNCDKE
eukprot:m51a1_g554 putative 3 -cyclic-nucleotide phosphodiesterase rega (668) ;mRNA; f:456763-459255